MTRFGLTLILVSAFTLIPCFGQGAVAATPAEQTLLGLEKERFEAIVEARMDDLDHMLDDTLVYVHSSSNVDSKQTYLAALGTGATDYLSIEPADLKVRIYGDTAILNGTARMKVKSAGQESNIHLRFTDVWVRRGSEWRMVSWQSTRIPD